MTTESDKQLANAERLAPVPFGPNGLIQFRTLDDAFRLSRAVFDSGMAPKQFGNAQAVLVAMLMGHEVGLKPMQSLWSIHVVGGTPKVWGATALALVRGSGELEAFDEDHEGDLENETRSAWVRIKRKGFSEKTYRYSVKDAKRAELWGKDNWKHYPDRMLLWRARGFALHDQFEDVLKGLRTVEESQDDQFEPARVIVKRRGRPAKTKPESDSPFEGQETAADSNPVPAGEESTKIFGEILARLGREGKTTEQFLEILRSNHVPGAEDAKRLEDVPFESLQMCLDHWEDVQSHFAEMKK